mmetsp:Transcript_42/g.142  ORF Transcript_42/g.142 Transcript_42/m.142 type:complete len:533 (+) Transcript_42:116-1714(+)
MLAKLNAVRGGAAAASEAAMNRFSQRIPAVARLSSSTSLPSSQEPDSRQPKPRTQNQPNSAPWPSKRPKKDQDGQGGQGPTISLAKMVHSLSDDEILKSLEDFKAKGGALLVEKPSNETSRYCSSVNIDNLLDSSYGLRLDRPKYIKDNDGMRHVLTKPVKNDGAQRAVRFGHVGTLDPFASGLLMIPYNYATKFGKFLKLDPKRYRARVQLGVGTETGDFTGEEKINGPADWVMPSEEIIKEMCKKHFTGVIEQVPPSYSAITVNGKRAYELARMGKEVVIPSRKRRVYECKSKVISAEDKLIEIEVLCEGGTYIRTIGTDLAEKLGTLGHLKALERIGLGDFSLSSLNHNGHLHLSFDECLANLPRVHSQLNLHDTVIQMAKGQFVPIKEDIEALPKGHEHFALCYEGHIIAVLGYDPKKPVNSRLSIQLNFFSKLVNDKMARQVKNRAPQHQDAMKNRDMRQDRMAQHNQNHRNFNGKGRNQKPSNFNNEVPSGETTLASITSSYHKYKNQNKKFKKKGSSSEAKSKND